MSIPKNLPKPVVAMPMSGIANSGDLHGRNPGIPDAQNGVNEEEEQRRAAALETARAREACRAQGEGYNFDEQAGTCVMVFNE